MRKLVLFFLATMMVLAFVGCNLQGGTPEWTEVSSLAGLEGTWISKSGGIELKYIITQDTITQYNNGANVSETSCKDFESSLGKGQINLFVNSNKTQLKFRITVNNNTIDNIYSKQ